MRRRSLLAVVGCLLAACGSDPGVRSDRADVVVTVPDATDPAVTDPVVTDPVVTDPGTTAPSTSPESPSPDGIGDELFPDLGNPGLDVQHYDVTVAYDPAADMLEGAVGLDLVVTEARSQITLDAVGLDVASVTVDGVEADFEVDDPELRITLPVAEPAGGALRVEVSYSVDTTPSTSSVGLPNGWFNTPDGSYVLNEPDGARSWLPSNDHPSDKASYTFTITVPEGVTAVANGVMVSQTTDEAGDTWVWRQDQPMTTYLIQLLTGDYELIEGSGPGGLPLVSAVLRDDVELMRPFLDVTAEQIAFFEDYFGPYPLDAYGIAITDSFGGLAMETQGRSLFSREDFLSGGLGFIEQLLLSHELAHQWFGNSVSPARWKDIWLNESFATYGQWMWFDHIGMGPLAQTAEFTLASRPPGATGDPTAGELFGFNSYDGGAVVLHALRLTIGDDRFFELLRRWVAENIGASRSTPDFIALAEDVADRDLTAFFDDWLFSVTPPAEYPPAQ